MNRYVKIVLIMGSCFLFEGFLHSMISLRPLEAVNFINWQRTLAGQEQLDSSAKDILCQSLSALCSESDFLQGSHESLLATLQLQYDAQDWWVLLLQLKSEELLPHCVVCKEVCLEAGAGVRGASYKLKCKHYSHKDCLLRWYANKPYKRCSKCPECMVALGRKVCSRLRRKKNYKKLVQKAYNDWSSSEIAEINFMAEGLFREEDLREIEEADALFAQQLQDEEDALGLERVTFPDIVFGSVQGTVENLD